MPENDLTLTELAELEEMSVRAIHICYRSGLDTLSKLLKFNAEGGDFLAFRNCGQRTANELLNICVKHGEARSAGVAQELPFDQSLLDKVKAFHPFKKAALTRHVDYLLSQLNVRSRNGIINSFRGRPGGMDIIETIFSDDFSFAKLRHIGEKSEKELSAFKQDISYFITVLEDLTDTELTKEYTKLILQATFPNISFDGVGLMSKIFDIKNKIRLFSMIAALISSRLIFNDTEREIFLTLNTNNDPRQIMQLASELDMSQERIRQIRVKLEQDMHLYFQFIPNLPPDDVSNYGVDTSTALLVINENFAERINEKEQVSFRTGFYAFIFSVLFQKSHVVFGYKEKLELKHKVTNNRYLSNFYMVRKETADIFSFPSFVNSVNAMLYERFPEDCRLYFKGYLAQFLTGSSSFLAEIGNVCELILLNEFDIVVNAEGYLIIERTTKVSVIEYVRDALVELDEMTRVDRILRKIQEMHPQANVTEGSIRSALQRDRENFIFIGRSSTYGLKKWEHERKGLKGGTIRDIVEEFLLKFDERKHISEITEYVQLFRNTNRSNIRTNLELEENNRFVIYPGEFIGLAAKSYKTTEHFTKVNGLHFTRAMMERVNGWELRDAINYFVGRFNYHPTQVEHILNRKLEQGDYSLSPDNKIIYEPN